MKRADPQVIVEPGTVQRDLDRVRRQGLGDLGQQPARDQAPPSSWAGDVELDLGRGLEVEAGQRQRAALDRQQQAGQDRHVGRVDKLRAAHATASAKRVTLDPELHRTASNWIGIVSCGVSVLPACRC